MIEETFMVCMRVDELDDPVDGSTMTACVECGVDIWISPESRKKLSQVGAMPLCSHCAKRMAQEQDELPQIGDLSDGQLEEVRARLREQAIAKGKDEWLSVLDGDEGMDIFEAFKATAQMAGEEMTEPNDDWGSMITFVDYNDTVFPPFPLGRLIKDGVPHDMIAKQLLPAMAQASQAKRVLIGLCPHADGVLKDNPDLGDVLILIDITAEGVQQMVMAQITRSPSHKPRLGEWVDVEPNLIDEGLFATTITSTLKFIASMRDQ